MELKRIYSWGKWIGKWLDELCMEYLSEEKFEEWGWFWGMEFGIGLVRIFRGGIGIEIYSYGKVLYIGGGYK